MAFDGLINKVPTESLKTQDTVTTYQCLSRIEWAFRSLKGMDLQIIPIHHQLENRILSHLLLRTCRKHIMEGVG